MRGDRFKRRLPKFVGQIADMDDLFYAEDKEFARVEIRLADFLNGLFVSGLESSSDPDYFLRRLEKDYGLESAGSIDDRIKAILLKMQAKRTTTEELILEICSAYGLPAKYYEEYKDYAYTLELGVGGDLDMVALMKSLREVTPAHLWINLNINFVRALVIESQAGDDQVVLWLCGEHLCGEIPWRYAIGQREDILITAVSGRYDAYQEYGYVSDGYRAGELRDDGNRTLTYLQNMSSKNFIRFTGGKEDD